ncbi:energy-coupling factor transport system substrate-specific component [Agreia bicolorata]|uniref:Energy-coupling factor transport system substrate-specific component n=1 Tax=Agreia bicolorata TaxID=110935 RepID=A0A1T4YBA5_9MICO|nr:ECF transporter S component [Agreia bicolorata]SKA98980.1 energy-coupling factor transport system substrate-specific component [Agreia bicolorata]
MKRASTAYLLTCAVLGVAGGLLLAPANWLSTALYTSVPFFSVAIAGLWLLPAIIALRLIQRPGAGLLVGVISGLVLAPFSGYGFSTVATNVWWAFFAEIGFLIVGYRFWTIWQHYAGAVVVGVAYPILARQSFDLDSYPVGIQIAFFALTFASCVAATAIGIGIAAALRRAGVGAAARRRPRSVASQTAQ